MEGNQAVAEGPRLPDSSFKGSTQPSSGERSRMVVAGAGRGEVASCGPMGGKCLLPKRSEFSSPLRAWSLQLTGLCCALGHLHRGRPQVERPFGDKEGHLLVPRQTALEAAASATGSSLTS